MIRDEKIVFTGTLDSMTRGQAQALVRALDGQLQTKVSKTTSILVVGKSNIDLFEGDSRSLKLKTTEILQRKGYNIKTISEEEFISRAIRQLKSKII